MVVAPTIADGVALQHLEQGACASASRRRFFACDHETGTHRAALGSAALAHADATQSCPRKAALVVGEFEIGLPRTRIVIGTQAQVLIYAIGIDHFTRVHFPVWVPDGFELTKGLNQFIAKHL